MRATEVEFRYRFFVITAIYVVGFACYAIDHVNTGEAIAAWVSGVPAPIAARHAALLLKGIFGVGALLAVAAAAIRTWAAAYLKSDVVHDLDLHSDALVADGPFRYVRNPLYVGGVLLGIGMGLMASRLGWVVINGAGLVFYWRLILREEAQLLESQGASYAAYCRTVPRLWPAFRPRVPSGGMPPRWRQAFLGEAFLWAFAAALAIFAATLKQKVPVALIYLVLVLYALKVFALRGRRKAPAAR